MCYLPSQCLESKDILLFTCLAQLPEVRSPRDLHTSIKFMVLTLAVVGNSRTQGAPTKMALALASPMEQLF
jgi:hypothetical protein